MDDAAIERARERLKAAAEGRPDPPSVEAALERARGGIEALAELAGNLEASLPNRVEDAVREGVRTEALPVARQLADGRGLSSQMIRRLPRLEGGSLAERHSRIDDLANLVDLITSGWKGYTRGLAPAQKN